MIDFEAIKTSLRPPAKREVIIEIISHGMNTPAFLRAMAYTLLNRMAQSELDNLGAIAIEAIEYFEKADFEGLKSFLARHKIAPQLIESILNYASHIAKIQ